MSTSILLLLSTRRLQPDASVLLWRGDTFMCRLVTRPYQCLLRVMLIEVNLDSLCKLILPTIHVRCCIHLLILAILRAFYGRRSHTYVCDVVLPRPRSRGILQQVLKLADGIGGRVQCRCLLLLQLLLLLKVRWITSVACCRILYVACLWSISD